MSLEPPLVFYPPPLKRNRQVRLLMGGAVLVASFCAYLGYRVIRQGTLERIERCALLEVQKGVNDIDMWLSNSQVAVQTIANTPQSQTVDWTRVRPYLTTEASRISDFVFLGLSDPQGFRYTTADNRRIDASDRQWFQRAIAGESHIDDPFISRAIGEPIIAISAPILDATQADNASPIGVIHGGVKVDRIAQSINELQYGSQSYSFLLNSEGRAIVHPDRELRSTVEHRAPSLLMSKEPDLAMMVKRMVDRQQGINRIQIKGKPYYVAYLSLQSVNWSVALVIPRSEIDHKLRMLDLMAWVILGLTGLMLFVLWQLHTFERRELEKAKISALIDERNRLAREIHDTLAQAFTGISLQLEAARGILESKPDKANYYMTRAGDLARRGLSEARRSVQALRSQALETDTLPNALQKTLKELSQDTQIQIQFQLKGTPIPLPEDLQLNLLRIGQEAITNVVRHAQATTLELTLHYQSNTVQLILSDNGIGFDVEPLVNVNGFGLVGIRERVDRFDGKLQLTSHAQKGTTIDVIMPLDVI